MRPITEKSVSGGIFIRSVQIVWRNNLTEDPDDAPKHVTSPPQLKRIHVLQHVEICMTTKEGRHSRLTGKLR